MPFNSLDFALFLPIVFLLYWLLSSFGVKVQNLVVVLVSYIFYSWWDWRFLSLILLTTITDYFIGLSLLKTQRTQKKKILLWTSISINIGVLVFFKYFNFFLDNFVAAFSFFGKEIEMGSLSIILPVGISFYTFQSLSYTIDVFRKKVVPTSDALAFAAFVGFFPQLVAGPIERAKNFLPQFYKKRTFDYSTSVDGLRQILWGLVKKVIIADNCAFFVNELFDSQANFSGSALLIGTFFFAFQIYGDFSGYSDIAIGTSRLFGLNLKKNFAFPYFSRNIAEFWRRWHISLTIWFREYLYIPLGGSRGSIQKTIRNIFIVFLISGLWHGANWTFLAWGLLNAIYFLPLLLTRRNIIYRDNVATGRVLPRIKDVLLMLSTFGLTMIGWIFFRAENISHALAHVSKIFSPSLFTLPDFVEKQKALTLLLIIFVFVAIEWIGRAENFAIERLGLKWKNYLRYTFYFALISALFWFGSEPQQFIYFQF
jgi:alginate O-acetyltransferase complex protein AlgI